MNHRTRVLSEGRSNYTALCSCKWIGGARNNIEDARFEANQHELTELRMSQSKDVKAPAELIRTK